MPDQLDTEALSFMQSRQAQFPSSKPIRNLNVTYGGKRHTNIPKKEWQAKTYKYISDEPERFVQYIEELRGDFTTEEKAKQAIIKKFHDDMSLRNLLDGLQRHGVTEREINALIRTKSVQEWLGYPSLARRLKTSLKTLRKQDKNINVNELQRVLDRLQKNREAKKKAKEAAGNRNVKIMGGANTVNQYLAAGLIDELWLHIAPVTIGAGTRLFDGVPNLNLEPIEVSGTSVVTHIRYNVLK